MRSLVLAFSLLTIHAPSSTALAQPATATGSAGAGSAGSAMAPVAAPPAPVAPPVAPAETTTAQRHACEAAIVKAKQAGDNLFVNDVSNVAAGAVSRVELVKTPDGAGCVQAIDADADFRSNTATAANQAAAAERAALAKKEHEDAARAIAKNEKHVVLAYGAMWLLAVGFVLFLWRRQQTLKSEIAQLRRDLEAATK